MLPLAGTGRLGVLRWVQVASLGVAALVASSLFVTAQKSSPANLDAAALQFAVDRAMAGLSGTAVVLDVESGRMLAQHRIEVAAGRLALPGSTIKPFTLRALFEAQAIRSGTRFVCPLKLELAGHRMDCSHPRTPEPLDAVSALAFSCNNYFAHFAARLDDAQLDRAYARAGLSSVSGLVPNESAGGVRQSGNSERHGLKALGAADVHVTPLGLLKAYRQLALIRRGESNDEALSAVFAGLEASVAWGMARDAGVEEMKVAGKTGTAGAAEGSWTHAWFVGYAPAEKPEIALVVFLERGTGATDASPVARQIFAAFRRARRQP